ncbi:MAG: class I SAM-dependent methyltransferase [Gammaproteobacteria bacterium]
MLISLDECDGLFRCPRSGKPLTRETGGLGLTDGDGNRYDTVDGVPVLVDFESSLLTPEITRRLSAPIKRSGREGLMQRIRTFFSSSHVRSASNAQRLVEMLHAGAASGSERPRVLVVGGGTVGHGMARLHHDADIALIAFDIYASPYVQFVADAHRIPLMSERFDAVVVQAVLEHVLEPATVVREIHRVLRPDGIVYAETPFMQQVHEGAYDFTRFTESGHRYLFRDFERLDSGVLAGVGTQLLWSLEYFARGLLRSRRAGKVLKYALIWLQLLDRLVPEAYNVDGASGVYFLGRRAARPMEPRDLITHYQGCDH